MPSDDRQDPGPVWPGSVPPSWNHPSEQAQSEEEPFFSYEQQQMAHFPPHADASSANTRFVDAEAEVIDDDYQAAHPRFASAPVDASDPLQQAWYFFRLIFLPLLLGTITALLVLPAIATGHAYLPSLMLWPMLVVIFFVVLAQGIAVYYTNALPHMWLVSTLSSLAVLALLGTFAVLGFWPGVLLLIVLAALCVYTIRHVFHAVPEGVVDIVFVQKKYKRTLYPGFNLLLPWEEVAGQVNIQETHWLCPPERIQLSPEEDVILRALISYQVVPEDAHLAVTRIDNWEDGLRELFITTVHTVATAFTPDDFLAWPQSLRTYQARRQFATDDFTGTPERRAALNNELLTRLSERCASWGVMVNWAEFRNINLAPHSLSALSADLSGIPTPPETAPLAGDHPAAPDEPTEILQADALTGTPPVPEGASAASAGAPPLGPQLPQDPHLKAETLKNLYKAVKDGNIKDPVTIRNIAASFEDVAAHDPQVCDIGDFDGARAAQNLYAQARKYEESYHAGRVP